VKESQKSCLYSGSFSQLFGIAFQNAQQQPLQIHFLVQQDIHEFGRHQSSKAAKHYQDVSVWIFFSIHELEIICW